MHLGRYSLILLVAAANALLLAALLLLPSGRHRGSRWLAALIIAIALRTAPYILGYAGAYDAYHWLTFAPFDVTLAWGPLLWVYVVTLSTGTAPARRSRHFVPVALQLTYQLLCFALPTPAKWSWYTGAHLTIVEPVGAVAIFVSLGVYGAAAWRTYEHWQSWLDDNVSNRDESRLVWLRVILLAVALTGVLGVVILLVHGFVTPLDYFARLPIIAALAALTYLLGFLGIRYGHGAIPLTSSISSEGRASTVLTAAPSPGEPFDAHVASAARDGMDDMDMRAEPSLYDTQSELWRRRVVQQRWYRDPQLTLAKLALLLNTSPRTLSRVLNEGLGLSFNDFVNALRVEEVAARLRQPGRIDVLRAALDAGFASKASFNRAFKRHTGTTPTGIRSANTPGSASQVPPTAGLARGEATE
jgi:AraC-like DNA-binding protein